MERYYADLFYHVGEGKASEVAALNRLDAREFYRLLDAIRRNHKPA